MLTRKDWRKQQMNKDRYHKGKNTDLSQPLAWLQVIE
jgi:hypothetical protein